VHAHDARGVFLHRNAARANVDNRPIETGVRNHEVAAAADDEHRVPARVCVADHRNGFVSGGCLDEPTCRSP